MTHPALHTPRHLQLLSLAGAGLVTAALLAGVLGLSATDPAATVARARPAAPLAQAAPVAPAATAPRA